jgi:hypothetical protein
MNQDRPRNAQSVAAGSSFVSAESIWRDIRFAVRSLLKAPGPQWSLQNRPLVVSKTGH